MTTIVPFGQSSLTSMLTIAGHGTWIHFDYICPSQPAHAAQTLREQRPVRSSLNHLWPVRKPRLKSRQQLENIDILSLLYELLVLVAQNLVNSNMKSEEYTFDGCKVLVTALQVTCLTSGRWSVSGEVFPALGAWSTGGTMAWLSHP